MAAGGIGKFQKAVGDQINPGDVLVEIETDKAQMDFECQDEGYVAKILVNEGDKDIPVGKPIAIFVEEEEDVAAFKDFTLDDVAGAAPAAPAAAEEPKKEEPKQEEPKKVEEPKKKEEAGTIRKEKHKWKNLRIKLINFFK